jgi:hypothetical protein
MGCYIDTTVVCAIAEPNPLLSQSSQAHIDKNQPAAIPYYALRELVAGPLKTICAAHTRLSKAADITQAFQSVLSLPPVSGRTKQGQMAALVQALGQCLSLTPKQISSNPDQSLDPAIRRRMTQYLAIAVQRQWASAKKIPRTTNAHQLACFEDGDFDYNEENDLVGPNGRFQCDPKQPCSAALHLRTKTTEVEKLIESLHPKNLSSELANKRENVRRRGALKEIQRSQRSSQSGFPKRDCRALGDAYFAIMCPPGSHVLTTNMVDHEPLCSALGKAAIKP